MMNLVGLLTEVTGRECCIDNNEYCYLSDFSKVEKKFIKEAEELLVEKTKEALRLERDSVIRAFEWRIVRNSQELELNLETTDNRLDLLNYIQYLRDIPSEIDFPNNSIKSYDEFLESELTNEP